MEASFKSYHPLSADHQGKFCLIGGSDWQISVTPNGQFSSARGGGINYAEKVESRVQKISYGAVLEIQDQGGIAPIVEKLAKKRGDYPDENQNGEGVPETAKGGTGGNQGSVQNSAEGY